MAILQRCTNVYQCYRNVYIILKQPHAYSPNKKTITVDWHCINGTKSKNITIRIGYIDSGSCAGTQYFSNLSIHYNSLENGVLAAFFFILIIMWNEKIVS